MDLRVGGLGAVKAIDVVTRRYVDVYVDESGQRICVGQFFQRTCFGATRDAVAAFRLVAEHPFRVMVVRAKPDGVEVLRYEYLVVLDAAEVRVLELWVDNLGRLRDQLDRVVEVENLSVAQRADGQLATVYVAVGAVAEPDPSRVVVRVLSPPLDGARAQYAMYLAASLGVASKETADAMAQFLQRFAAEFSRLERRVKELETLAARRA